MQRRIGKLHRKNKKRELVVRWAHHPQEIKNAMKHFGFHPKQKQCFANCQRFFNMCHNSGHPLAKEIEYREGWILSVSFHFEHAWLIYKGEVLDLTVQGDDIIYLKSTSYTLEQIRDNMINTGLYTPVSKRALQENSPKRSQEEKNTYELLHKIWG